MKLIIVYSTAVLLISCSSFEQTVWNERQQKREDRNQSCKVTNKHTLADRIAMYPFNKASEIRLVSFDHRPDTTIIDHQLPEINGQADLSKMTEQKILSSQQIDSLTHILFNIGFRGKPETIEAISCYNPRNAIIYIDAKGQPLEFIEICFECKKIRLSSSQIPTGEFCTQKYDLLKDFFFRCGVKIGTTKGIEWWKQ